MKYVALFAGSGDDNGSCETEAETSASLLLAQKARARALSDWKKCIEEGVI